MFRHSMCRISDSEVKDLKAKYITQHGQFVLPIGYAGHAHTFCSVTTGVQLCTLCGAEHVCFRGQCPEAPNDEGELVCTITGCVTTLFNLCNERDVHTRTSEAPTSAHSRASRRQRPSSARNSTVVHRIQIDQLHSTVTSVVHELLNSDTTQRCMVEESIRANAKVGVVLGRILREMNSTLATDSKIDMISVETSLAYTFRRLRDGRAVANARKNIDAIIAICIQSIVSIINQHGWYRTCRQLTHVPRGTHTRSCMHACAMCVCGKGMHS